jgi:cytochrome d ubiquinol oxidase subunit II
MTESEWIPLVFSGIMALAILVYAVLDGYDLGVGILLPKETRQDRDTMIASIGPFWDANETWLVLAVGLLLIAFPEAHNLIFYELYLPTTVLLISLIARGVAFDFRAKAAIEHQDTWDRVFHYGSMSAAASQGYMLGQFVIGFDDQPMGLLFSLLSAGCVAAAYTFMGAAWLVMKTEGELQQYAATKGRRAGWVTFIGVVAVCLVNPAINPSVFDVWFSLPAALG